MTTDAPIELTPIKTIEVDFGKPADFTVFDLNKSYIIYPDEFLSKGRATPFRGWEVSGRCRMTVCGGKVVYKEN